MRKLSAVAIAALILVSTQTATIAQPAAREAPFDRREDPAEAQRARKLLNGLDAEHAYVAIRKEMGHMSQSVESLMPYISLDLAKKTVKEMSTRGANDDRVTDFQAAWKVFPEVQVTEVTKAQSNVAFLTVIPSSPIAARTASDVTMATIEMRFEGGYWRVHNVVPLRTNDWCMQAARMSPPGTPAYGNIMGSRFTVIDAKESSSGITLEFQNDGRKPTVTAQLNIPELIGLRQKVIQSKSGRYELRHPSTSSGRSATSITPERTTIYLNNTLNKRTLQCSNGFGLSLVASNYRLEEADTKECIDCSILLRFPDKERSLIEGTFTIENQLSRPRR
jgi:hypothetical protein